MDRSTLVIVLALTTFALVIAWGLYSRHRAKRGLKKRD